MPPVPPDLATVHSGTSTVGPSQATSLGGQSYATIRSQASGGSVGKPWGSTSFVIKTFANSVAEEVTPIIESGVTAVPSATFDGTLEERDSDYAAHKRGLPQGATATISIISVGVVAAVAIGVCSFCSERQYRARSADSTPGPASRSSCWPSRLGNSTHGHQTEPAPPEGSAFELRPLPPASLPCNHSLADSTVPHPNESAASESRATEIKTTKDFDKPRSDSLEAKFHVPAVAVHEGV